MFEYSLISPLPPAAEEGGKSVLCCLKYIRVKDQNIKAVSLDKSNVRLYNQQQYICLKIIKETAFGENRKCGRL